MNLKSILKSLKLHESTISMILGAIVIVVVGVLVVNYFRDLETGTTLPTGKTTEGPTRIRNGQTFHVVEVGDTLWTVAEKYYDSGYNWVDIASVNELTNPGQIDVDQELLIPDIEPKQPTVSVSASSGELEPISGATYAVVQGDSLWNIAVRAYGDGYRWVDLVQENELANPDLIHAGNMLVLPR